VSDKGAIVIPDDGGEVSVQDARRPAPGLIVHIGSVVEGSVEVGQEATLLVDNRRRWDIRRNHTATHILHQELRNHLGRHVLQKGSLVAPDRLRFDFSHGEAVSAATLAEIEAAINETIFENLPVSVTFMGQREAIDRGAMALFGEKYGDVVRTIKIGENSSPYSFELCGGLHVTQTGDIGLFRFTNEEAVAAGVRRVEAVTGRGAQRYVSQRLNTLARVAEHLNAPVDKVTERVDGLLDDNRALQKEVERLQRRLAREQFTELLDQMVKVDDVNLLAARVDVAGADELREMADWFRDRVQSGVAVFATVQNEKPLLVATVTEDVIQRGVKAGDLVREVAKMVGGGGGGRPNLAQAGGRDANKLPEALAAVPNLVAKDLK
jgi:alanyl-tRNA synthetase